MASAGLSRVAGAALTDFDHVRQSIGVILNTPIGSRVMRREFGSEVHELIDRPINDQVILAIYSAAVLAIARWEPRYAVTACSIVAADASGEITLRLVGVYYPKGHLGDFSTGVADMAIATSLLR